VDRRLTVLALLLAGCAEAPGAPGAPTAEGTTADAAFAWSGCDGAGAILYGPAALYPSSAPAGWGPGATPVVDLRISLLECARVSWGPFERGPVLIAQEWRDDFRAPAACAGRGSELRFILESIWFSDPHLAGHAAGLGMPAGAAEFTRTLDGARHGWAWGPPGHEPSRATFAEAPASRQRVDEFARRLLWADGAGVGALDLRTTSLSDQADPYLAAGALRPPTLYGRAHAVPDFASAPAGLVLGLEAAGVLTRYGDSACSGPS
jgi:hypothetical protein